MNITAVQSSETESNRLVGIIRDVGANRNFGFVTNVKFVQGDTFVHLSGFNKRPNEFPPLGTWIEYDFEMGPKGPRALNAAISELGPTKRMRRLLLQYGKSMETNHGSLRLDGLTQMESRDLKDRGIISPKDYYAAMSENGLKQVALRWEVEYRPGHQLETAAAIVSAIEQANLAKRSRERA